VEAERDALTERVLGVDFYIGTVEAAAERIAAGGLLTAPSAIGLAHDLTQAPAYRRALQSSDMVLTDSGLLVWAWRWRSGRALPRTSGLKFLRHWLARPEARVEGAWAWIMPRAEDVGRTRTWLAGQGIASDAADFYVAPWYGAGEIEDPALVAWLGERRPRMIYLGIGGGVQERLGLYLRERLSYRPTILCLGAALAFLTGAQVSIPIWVDRARLGWLWRSVTSPCVYGGRYFRSFRLIALILRHGASVPPLSDSTPGKNPP
jgi:hypothetical protein